MVLFEYCAVELCVLSDAAQSKGREPDPATLLRGRARAEEGRARGGVSGWDWAGVDERGCGRSAEAGLAEMAAANLRRAGVLNASVREADGALGLSSEAPFDLIMLSGSVAELPQVLLDQIKIGGRLLAIVGQEPVMRAVRITRLSATTLKSEDLFDTVAPRLIGIAEPSRFTF